MSLRRRARIKDPAGMHEELKGRCQPLLGPGERAPTCHSGRSWDTAGRLLGRILVRFLALFVRRQWRLLCVTDRVIVILDADRDWTPLHVITVLSRDIEFGPVSGAWSCLDGLGGGLYVPETFHAVVAVADAELKAMH
jgi:hypothetical protein